MKKILLGIIVAIVLLLLGNALYTNITQEPKTVGKLMRLDCHKKTTAFERGYGDEDIDQVKKILQEGYFTLTSGIDKATYMESTLFNFVDIEQLQERVQIFLAQKFPKEDMEDKSKQPITIDFTVYENDTEDPKKKSDNCKLFRGYVVMKLKNHNNKVVYQVQIDFLDHKGEDIFQTLECAIESFITFPPQK